MCADKTKLSRREMLALASTASTGAFSHPLKAALAGLLTGIVGKAYGQSGTGNPRNYIMFQLAGGPSRWTWEPMVPYGDPNQLIKNKNVVNKFIANSSGNYTTAEYKSVELNGINMPWLWQFDLPTASGGSRPMSDLMDDLLMIRGINVVNPAHNGAQDIMFRPSGISNTITSIGGDVSDRPIPFIGMRTTPNPYTSKLQKSGVNSLSSSGNWIETLLKPFEVNAATFEGKLKSMDSTLSEVFKNIEDFSNSSHPGFAASTKSQQSAIALIKKSFGNLSTEFYSRRDKYRNLLKIATNAVPDGNSVTRLVGINDKPIIVGGVDIRKTLNSKKGSASISYMAEQFAVIEFALVNELTSCVAAGLRAFSGYGFDEHSADPMVAALTNNMWNRGFATCLMELIDRLKAAGTWNDTVVSIAGEFGRTPKGTANGSDHAQMATCISYFSGSFAGNEILGDTKRSASNSRYPGTWGEMANNDTYGILSTGHVAATIATMLRVDSPVTNATSLVAEEGGKIVSKIGKSKLV